MPLVVSDVGVEILFGKLEPLPTAADTAPVRETLARAAEIKALAPERYKLQFTVSRETHDRLREAQHLLRHRIPDGDIAAIFDHAMTVLLAELRKGKHAAVDRPCSVSSGSTGRHLPAAVKRAVWERDQGPCAFVAAVGRCTERGFLSCDQDVAVRACGARSGPSE